MRGTTRIPARSQYVGMNLAGIAYYSSQFPFADLMKSSMGWISRDDDGTWGAPFPSLTADGYPAALAPGQHALSAVAWAGSHYAPGRYVVLWDGDGTISFPLSNVSVAESAPNRITIDVVDTTGNLWVAIDRTSASNPVRNLRFLWPGTEATYAHQPFNPLFLDQIAPFSLLRFIDWGATNGSPVVEWADRAHLRRRHLGDAGRRADRDHDRARQHPARRSLVLHPAPGKRRLRAPVRDPAARPPRPGAARPHRVLERGLEHRFAQTTWANARSQALGLQSPFGQPAIFYAMRSVQIFKIIQGVFGPAESGRIVRVLAGQAVWDNFLSHLLAYQDTAANADVMAIAPYFNAAAAGDPANVATTLTLSSDQIVDQMLANIRGDIKSSMTANAALAAGYKLKLKAYESGAGDSSSYFPADKQDAMTALFMAAHTNPRMRNVYREYYGQWVAAGGDTMNQYSDIGNWSKWGLWGSLQYVTQDPATAPKYQGLMDFIPAHPPGR